MPDITIRDCDLARDLSALSRIWFDASCLAHGFMGEARLCRHRELVETAYLPHTRTFVACTGGVPAGFISLLGDFIGALFVAPDRQRLGIGRALIAHAADLRGELALEVYAANAGARAFYAALGFRETSRRPRDSEDLPYELIRLLRPG